MVDSMSTLSSFEITRNPFDSGREERTNCPGFSPSMFCNQETPASQKVRCLRYNSMSYLDRKCILLNQ